MIGGLIQNRSVDENSSVPFLSDIPLLGELFKQKGKSTEKTELVILLRPTVTNAQTFYDDMTESRARFGQFRNDLLEPTETSFTVIMSNKQTLLFKSTMHQCKK